MIENDELFPNKTNVEIIEIINESKIKMRVWERGAGITLACGSGVVCRCLRWKIKKNVLKDKVEVQFRERIFIY